MGSIREDFVNKAKAATKKVGETYEDFMELEKGGIDEDDFPEEEIDPTEDSSPYEENIQQAQKPESFHHFLLENKYKVLELAIRGYKEVYNKTENKWEIKRREIHCFTAEEAESILRTAQTHLSTDIKLSYISMDNFPKKMLMLHDQLSDYFYTIADYKYGRYKDEKEQFFMKQDNLNIFVMLMASIEANYSRAIKGIENKNTHGAVKGQESLNSSESTSQDKGYY